MSDVLITGPFSIGPGRRKRWPYVKAVIVQSLMLIGAYFGIATFLGSQTAFGAVLAIAISVAGVVLYLGISAQRCRDCGWSGWFSLLTLVPVVGLIPVIALLVMPGHAAEPSRISKQDKGSRRRRQNEDGSGSALVSAALAGRRKDSDQAG